MGLIGKTAALMVFDPYTRKWNKAIGTYDPVDPMYVTSGYIKDLKVQQNRMKQIALSQRKEKKKSSEIVQPFWNSWLIGRTVKDTGFHIAGHCN